MYKFKDTELVFNRRIRDSLSDIYGVGFQKSSYICDLLGFGTSYNINLLNRFFYELLVIILKYYYILDDRLKGIIMQRLNFFVENRRIVGLRLLKGLPVRGQRTHTNRQSARRLKPFFLKKEEVVTITVSKKDQAKGKKNNKVQQKSKAKKKK